MTCWRRTRAYALCAQATARRGLPARLVGRVLLLSVLALLPALAGAASEKKAIAFVADSLNWLDVPNANTPNLNRLIAESAIAGMSCSPATPARSERSYVTLGAGSRAAHEWKQTGPPVEQLNGRLGYVGIEQLRRANERLTYDVEVGSVGRGLHQAGLRTAVVGNGDWLDGSGALVPWRWAIGIAMDDQGVVDLGEVGDSLVRREVGARNRLWTDQAKLLAALDRCLTRADLIVIESGDTARVSQMRRARLITHSEAQQLKQQALAQMDQLLGGVLKHTQPDWLFLFVTPSPSPSRFHWLTPLIVRGPGYGGGLLTSGTTLRPGLAATIDFAPTVLGYFDLPTPRSFTGRALRVGPARDEQRLPWLAAISLRSHHMDQLRRFFFPFFVACEMVFLGLCAPALYRWPRAWPPWAWKGLAGLQLAILATGPASFLSRAVAPAQWTASVLLTMIAGLTLVLVVLAMHLSARPLAPIAFLSGLQAVIMLADQLTGAKLQLASLFGYSPVVGGRFYGISNESMCLLLGSTMLGTAALLHTMGRHRRDLAAREQAQKPAAESAAPGGFTALEIGSLSVLFVLCVVVIGFPRLGANAGGTIAGVAAYAAMIFMLLPRRRRWLAVVLTAALIAFFLGLFILADLRQPPEVETHVGRAVRLIAAGSWPAFWRLATHKLARNLNVLFYSVWVIPLIGWMVCVTWGLLRPVYVVRQIYAQCQALRAAVIGCIVGGIVGFAFNDTGVAIPAVILTWTIYSLSYASTMLRASRELAAPAASSRQPPGP